MELADADQVGEHVRLGQRQQILAVAELRELARGLGLPVADKEDSQEICFVPNGDYAAFLEAYLRGRAELPDGLPDDVAEMLERWERARAAAAAAEPEPGAPGT